MQRHKLRSESEELPSSASSLQSLHGQLSESLSPTCSHNFERQHVKVQPLAPPKLIHQSNELHDNGVLTQVIAHFEYALQRPPYHMRQRRKGVTLSDLKQQESNIDCTPSHHHSPNLPAGSLFVKHSLSGTALELKVAHLLMSKPVTSTAGSMGTRKTSRGKH